MFNRCLFLFVVALFLFLTACSVDSPTQHKLVKYKGKTSTNEHSEVDQTDTLTIWTPDNSFDSVVERFNQTYPNVTVEVVVVEQDELVTKYKESILNKETPDLFMIPTRYLGEFSGITGLEDLSDPAYTKTDIVEHIPDALLDRNKTISDQRLYAFPIWVFPLVTYYRADILEAQGFPSEPDELATYMESMDNWLNMAEKLKEEGHFLLEYPQSLLSALDTSSYQFDKELNYRRDTTAFRNAMEVAKVSQEKGLTLNNTIWSEEGQQALQDGKLVMVFQPSYGHDLLMDWLPEQSGKWRATKLPFGHLGSDQQVGKHLAIASDSNNKQLAWQFIQIASGDMMYMYMGDNRKPYFAEQDLNGLYMELLRAEVPGLSTPLDHYADEVWELNLYKLSTGTPASQDLFMKIEKDINDKIRVDKRAIENLLDIEINE